MVVLVYGFRRLEDFRGLATIGGIWTWTWSDVRRSTPAPRSSILVSLLEDFLHRPSVTHLFISYCYFYLQQVWLYLTFKIASFTARDRCTVY